MFCPNVISHHPDSLRKLRRRPRVHEHGDQQTDKHELDRRDLARGLERLVQRLIADQLDPRLVDFVYSIAERLLDHGIRLNEPFFERSEGDGLWTRVFLNGKHGLGETTEIGAP